MGHQVDLDGMLKDLRSLERSESPKLEDPKPLSDEEFLKLNEEIVLLMKARYDKNLIVFQVEEQLRRAREEARDLLHKLQVKQHLRDRELLRRAGLTNVLPCDR